MGRPSLAAISVGGRGRPPLPEAHLAAPPDRGLIEPDLRVGEFDFGGEIRERKGALVFIEGQVAHHPVPISGHLVGEGPGGLVVPQRDQQEKVFKQGD